MPKKILIISYYWPPAGGPGVQRWLKFCKYLPEFGWESVVYTPENPSYPMVDESLISDILPHQKTIKTKIWEPYQLAELWTKKTKKYKAGQFDTEKNQDWKSKLSLYIRGNFFVPDARKFWVKPSVKILKNYLKQNPTDVIVSSGPPHSMHLIGLELKKQFPNITWIADFRDPWTDISYYNYLKLSSFANKKHHELENKVLQTADICLATSYTDTENFRKKGANAHCITNGFDGEICTKKPEKTSQFTLSYIGVLEQLRNPEVLWKALIELCNEHKDFSENLELKFVGRLDDKIQTYLSESPLQQNCTFTSYLPHQEAVTEMKTASLLLICNFPNPESKGIIPGKLFEYLTTQNPILSIGPGQSDVSIILQKTHAGKHFSPTNALEIKNYILQQFQLWKIGNNSLEPTQISDFHRKNLTQQLVNLLLTSS